MSDLTFEDAIVHDGGGRDGGREEDIVLTTDTGSPP